MYVCMYVCMYVYVCMSVYVYVCDVIHIHMSCLHLLCVSVFTSFVNQSPVPVYIDFLDLDTYMYMHT